MEYIQGYKINEMNHNKTNIKLLINIFIMESLFNYDIIHGDLHIGNLKTNQTNDKIIIYDFGYCWENPKNKKRLNNINHSMIIYNYSYDYNEKKKNFIEFLKINKINNEKYINDFYEINNIEIYLKYLINICYKNNIQLDIYLINLILMIIHIQKYTNGNILMLDQYNYCNTYEIFDNYKILLLNDLEKYDILNQIDNNNNDNFNNLKKFII